MKKFLGLLIILMFTLSVNAGNSLIIDDSTVDKDYISAIEKSEILEDVSGEFTLADVQNLQQGFKPVTTANLNLDFTSSTYWIKFIVENKLNNPQSYLVEIARPLTNEANFTVFDGNDLVYDFKSGDDLNFSLRPFEHRKLLFPITLNSNTTYHCYVKVRSDGEVLNVPIKFWKPEALDSNDYKEQFILGFYYGMLGFIIIIYFFFYQALRDNTFLYYVLYVVSLLFFQLSIDGLAFQYLWPNSTWVGNHAILFFASTTVFLINKYAKTYLKTNEQLPFCESIFNVFLLLSAFTTVLSFTSGKIYALAFPITNVLALISTLYILVAIVIAVKKHCKVNVYFITAFLFLIAGSILFILGNFSIIEPSMFTEHGIKFGSAFEVIFLSISMAGKYRDALEEKEKAQAQAMEKLEEINKLKEDANVKLEQQVIDRTKEIEYQKEEIEEKNKDILGSIEYSKRIQNAILPSNKLINELLPESFVLYNPKDIVSGDFYWIANTHTSTTNEEVILFSVADCTGHGVPGAFMSLIGNNYLKMSLQEKEVNSPADALDYLNKGVNSTLQQNDVEKLRDGMDIALCAWFKSKNRMYFAGAKNPLYIIKNGELIEYKADKHPVGAHVEEELQPFTNNEIVIEGGEVCYVFSDGFADQFGGPKGKKFMYKRFKELLIEIHQKPMKEQKDILWKTFVEWKGDLEQVDDVCIIGVKL